MKKLYLLALPLVIWFLASCAIFPIIIGNGNLVNIERKVSSFEKISSSGSAELLYHASQEYRVVVTTDSNLIDYVDIVTKNGVLSVKFKGNKSYSYTRFIIDVYCPTLSGVSISGSASFTGSDKIVTSTFDADVSGSGRIDGTIECNNVSAKISGSGRINIIGSGKNANINISGSGKFIGNEFRVEDAVVDMSGSADASIWATNNLRVKISGSGRLNYRGRPLIDSKISGSGRITSME